MFEHQLLDFITTSVDAIVIQNKWYTALPLTKNFKGLYLIVEQTNDGAADETIEVEYLIDGVALTPATLLGSGVATYHGINTYGAVVTNAAAIPMVFADFDQTFPLETKSLRLRVRQTSVVDAVAANIEVNMVYATKGMSA